MALKKPDTGTSTHKVIKRSDYRRPNFTVTHTDLDFDIKDDRTEVRSRMQIKHTGQGDKSLTLYAREIDLNEIKINGTVSDPATWTRDGDAITIPNVPDQCVVEVRNTIYPDKNTALEGMFTSGNTHLTHCEAQGFRRITAFPDRPDVLSTFKVRLAADKAKMPVLLSNGDRIDSGDLSNGRHYAVWQDKTPKPCYLFAAVTGDLAVRKDEFTTQSGKKVELGIYVDKSQVNQTGFAMSALKKSMKWDEQRFGREYQNGVFNIVAVDDFNSGACENTGLNIFNTKNVLADPRFATDADILNVERVIAHEYFHNWTGNRVTVANWFELTLKEGLTVWRDQQFTSDLHDRGIQRVRDAGTIKRLQFKEDASPMSHPVRPDELVEMRSVYTTTVYKKGATVVQALNELLGPKTFRKGMDTYFDRHDGQAVTCDDFVSAFEAASGRDLSQFRRWYSTAGTPVVEAQGQYDAATKRYTLTLSQSIPSNPGAKPLHMPLPLALYGQDGRRLTAEIDGKKRGELMVELTGDKQVFTFEGVEADPVLSLNRRFASPVEVKTPQSDADLALLMRVESDPYARYEAAQTLYKRESLRLMEQAGKGLKKPTVSKTVLDAVGHVIRDDAMHPMLKAELLSLPTRAQIAAGLDRYDLGAISKGTGTLGRAIASRYKKDFALIYRGLAADKAPYKADFQQAGRRELKAVALGMIGRVDPRARHDLANRLYRGATNMTDRLMALKSLNGSGTPQARAAMRHYKTTFQDQPLAVNQWFRMQVTGAGKDALQKADEMMKHPEFDITNPNRLRAVVGAVTGTMAFHKPDGTGYQWLADLVIKLDKINPRLAASLASPLRDFAKLEGKRGPAMKSAIEKIAATPGLSTNVTELTRKALGPAATPKPPADAPKM
ncbi:MAG: aminopeptidase N [Alphaproteobacteria bacterium]